MTIGQLDTSGKTGQQTAESRYSLGLSLFKSSVATEEKGISSTKHDLWLPTKWRQRLLTKVHIFSLFAFFFARFFSCK
jgi:hypothetical protein